MEHNLGKRSNFERKPRDYYCTPLAAVMPLITHLPNSFTFAEPCAGDGRLIDHIQELHSNCECTWASDIEPKDTSIDILDALDLNETHVSSCDLIITNPPWIRTKLSGYLLHELITTFSDLRPTWLLFDADWLHTVQSSELVKSRLCKIVSIGRVKWIEDSAGTGKDNCVWYLFDVKKDAPTQFIGR
jgi:hypothetical protein